MHKHTSHIPGLCTGQVWRITLARSPGRLILLGDAQYFQHNHCNVCHPRTQQRVSRKRQILSAQSLQCLPPPHTKTCIKKAPDTFSTITAMFATPAHYNVYQESAKYFQHNHCNVCHPRTQKRVSRKRQILSAQSLQCLPAPHTKTCIKKAPDNRDVRRSLQSCRSAVWNLLLVIFLTLRIWRRLLSFS